MKQICVQVQPGLDPRLSLDAVRAAFDAISASPLVLWQERSEGKDQGPWLNFLIGTNDLACCWALLQRTLYQESTLGGPLTKCSIAVCEGMHGWDDYLLLHHLDPSEPLDTL